jgi:hypothetical protein
MFLKNKKVVKFNTFKKLYFIPDLNFYIKENLIDELWYSDDDFKNFKNSTIFEINELMNKHPNMIIKDAIFLLYENTKIIYNSSFFI